MIIDYMFFCRNKGVVKSKCYLEAEDIGVGCEIFVRNQPGVSL